jgi:hypothetical protein
MHREWTDVLIYNICVEIVKSSLVSHSDQFSEHRRMRQYKLRIDLQRIKHIKWQGIKEVLSTCRISGRISMYSILNVSTLSIIVEAFTAVTILTALLLGWHREGL